MDLWVVNDTIRRSDDRGFFGRFVGPMRPDLGRFGFSRECRPKGLSARGDEPEGGGYRIRVRLFWRRSNDRAVDRGDARAGKRPMVILPGTVIPGRTRFPVALS
jgi:hypothetical protein